MAGEEWTLGSGGGRVSAAVEAPGNTARRGLPTPAGDGQRGQGPARRRVRSLVNSALDRFVRPELPVLGIPRSSFTVSGCSGFVLAVVLAFLLFVPRGRSPAMLGAIAVAAAATFLTLGFLTRIATGQEFVVYYHQMIAAFGVTSLLVSMSGHPVLPYLDVTALAAGLTLASFRVGCLMVGCCHGRPAGLGVCYLDQHAAVGFPPCYVGVRLFPVQALEALTVLGITVVGGWMALRGEAPGTALAFYVVTYAAARYCFEFLRGDASRPYLGGFSQAQWTSLLLSGAVGLGVQGGLLPGSSLATLVFATLVGTSIVVSVTRAIHGRDGDRLFRARHVREIAEGVRHLAEHHSPETVPAGGGGIQVYGTSLGLHISSGRIELGGACFVTYTISLQGREMTHGVARRLARLILRLRKSASSAGVFPASEGVFHLVAPIP